MSNSTSFSKKQEYNTSIKDIAGIKDYTAIFNIINSYFDKSELSPTAKISENDILLRTSLTRIKVSWAINKSILQFKDQNHRDLANTVFRDNVPLQDKKFAFFWHLCLTNKLFKEITTNVFAKVYFSGRAQISKNDIIAYVKEISSQSGIANPNWSEDTIYRIATKYLSLMTKFDFVSEGRVKSINHIHLTNEALVIFLYFSNLCPSISKNLYENELIPASFTAEDEILNKLKKLSVRGLFNMSYDGITLKVELTYGYKEICNVIYS